jgi:hypothetical protein
MNPQTSEITKKESIVSTDILIVGFGLSIIPLIRELEKDGVAYTLISDGNSIWEKLDKEGRLDFDLVSSRHTSMYSFELINQSTKDDYPTALEFLEFQRKYIKEYGSKLITDRVTEVQNHKDHSLIFTRSGQTYKAKNVIFATAFKRIMNKQLNEFNYDEAAGKTVVFNVYGDSANLMVSKLVPRNSKVIILTNGFVSLDKLSYFRGVSYTLDQLEFHNIRFLSKFMYENIVTGLASLKAGALPHKLALWLFGNTLSIKHPTTDRLKIFKQDFERSVKSPFPNGLIAIKYWPVDAYQKLFDDNELEKHIQDGYQLNDIGLFIDNGMVTVLPKEDTVIDHTEKTIRTGEETIQYDILIEGDREQPNLPPITYYNEHGEQLEYVYDHRNSFMGVIPKELSNIYLIGYTRPTSGGLANIIEMQDLFTHKLLTDKEFHASIHKDLDQKIEKYNRQYYTAKDKRYTDHLVFYGFYNEDLARLMKINPKVSQSRSLKQMFQYYLSPNNAYKYRKTGPYKVDGVQEMSEEVWKEHKGFGIIKHFILNFILVQLNVIALFALLPIPWYVKVPLIFIQLFNPFIGLIQSQAINLHHYQNLFLIGGLIGIAFLPGPIPPLVALSLTLLLTVVGRKMGWSRLMFNDLKNKSKYTDFLKRYLDAYKNVIQKKGKVKKQVKTMA